MNNKTFLEEFINYSNQIFPAIDSSVRNSIKEALRQFDINKFSLNLQYRGSRNQRIIDVKKSLEQKEVVLIDKYLPDKDYTSIYEKPEYMFI